MKFCVSFLFFFSLSLSMAKPRVCSVQMRKDLCDALERYSAANPSPYFWSRVADRLLGVPPRIGGPNGLLCYDSSTGGKPKNPELCRRVAPTICEWGEDMEGRVRCYENYKGRMVGGGPISDYLCRESTLCTPENLAAEDHFY